MTLSEQFCGIPAQPSVSDKPRFIAWLRQRCPTLTQDELEREHLWRCIGFLERFGFWPE